MLEAVTDRLPELAKIEETVASLEREVSAAQQRVLGLAQRLQQTKAQDLDNAARAANAGRRRPQPKAPDVASQLDEAEDALALLQRRLELAQQDRSLYVPERGQEIISVMLEARDDQASAVAKHAGETLQALLTMYATEDQGRAIERQVPVPVETNTSDPSPITNIYSVTQTLNTGSGAPRRGDIQSILEYLISLGTGTVVEDNEILAEHTPNTEGAA
jgi:hypothetical protein